jgi:hypothetical protein
MKKIVCKNVRRRRWTNPPGPAPPCRQYRHGNFPRPDKCCTFSDRQRLSHESLGPSTLLKEQERTLAQRVRRPRNPVPPGVYEFRTPPWADRVGKELANACDTVGRQGCEGTRKCVRYRGPAGLRRNSQMRAIPWADRAAKELTNACATVGRQGCERTYKCVRHRRPTGLRRNLQMRAIPWADRAAKELTNACDTVEERRFSAA